MKFQVDTYSLSDTNAAAAEFAKTLKAGDTLALVGDLGAGKTTFAKGIITALQSGSSWFNGSPTFTLIQEYRDCTPVVFHFDFYRIKEAEELLNLGWQEYLMEEGIMMIEWANRFPELLPNNTRWLKLESITEKHHKIYEIHQNDII